MEGGEGEGEEQVETERGVDCLSRCSSLLAVGGRLADGTLCNRSAVLSEEQVCASSSCNTSSTTLAPENADKFYRFLGT